MVTALCIVAGLAALIGFGLLSEATRGVGIIALGCLAGILARIAQAAQNHIKMQDFLQKELEYLASKYARPLHGD